MKAKICDIAHEANCSISTVSRVMNGTTYPVDPFVKRKIIDVSIRSGFLPPFLRNIGKERYGVIGVIIPCFSNPYYSNLVKGIEQVAKNNNYSVFVASSDRSAENEYINCRKFIKSGIDGLIISSMVKDNDLLTILNKIKFPVVRFSSIEDDSEINSILYDYKKASQIAVNYLIKKGHRKIGFASGEFSSPDRLNLYDGFCIALSCAGIQLNHSYVYIYDGKKGYGTELEIGETLADKIAASQDKPTGIFCLNDSIALGCINTLTHKYDMQVPDDISIIGFDNLKTGEFINPPLTTIKQDANEIGILGATMLVELIQKKKIEKTIRIEPELIIRNSVAPLE